MGDNDAFWPATFSTAMTPFANHLDDGAVALVEELPDSCKWRQSIGADQHHLELGDLLPAGPRGYAHRRDVSQPVKQVFRLGTLANQKIGIGAGI